MSGERDRRELLLNAAAEGSAAGLNPRDYTEKLLTEAADGTDPRSNARTHTDLFINAISVGGGQQVFSINGYYDNPSPLPEGLVIPREDTQGFSGVCSFSGYDSGGTKHSADDIPLVYIDYVGGEKILSFANDPGVESATTIIVMVADATTIDIYTHITAKIGGTALDMNPADPNKGIDWTCVFTDERQNPQKYEIHVAEQTIVDDLITYEFDVTVEDTDILAPLFSDMMSKGSTVLVAGSSAYMVVAGTGYQLQGSFFGNRIDFAQDPGYTGRYPDALYLVRTV